MASFSSDSSVEEHSHLMRSHPHYPQHHPAPDLSAAAGWASNYATFAPVINSADFQPEANIAGTNFAGGGGGAPPSPSPSLSSTSARRSPLPPSLRQLAEEKDEDDTEMEDIQDGWVDATGVFDTQNFPTDITAKDNRSLWQRFRRPFANVQGGANVGWRMVFPPEREKLFRRIKRPTWRSEFAHVCAFWILCLTIITVSLGVLHADSDAFISSFVGALVVFACEILFTLFLVLLLSQDVKTNILNLLLATSIIVTAIAFRLAGGSSSILFLVILLVYGGLTAMSLLASVALITFMIAVFLAIEITCARQDGYSNRETTAIALDALTYLTVNAFGVYYAYFLHHSIRHSYLKTLAFARNERGTDSLKPSCHRAVNI